MFACSYLLLIKAFLILCWSTNSIDGTSRWTWAIQTVKSSQSVVAYRQYSTVFNNILRSSRQSVYYLSQTPIPSHVPFPSILPIAALRTRTRTHNTVPIHKQEFFSPPSDIVTAGNSKNTTPKIRGQQTCNVIRRQCDGRRQGTMC